MSFRLDANSTSEAPSLVMKMEARDILLASEAPSLVMKMETQDIIGEQSEPPCE